MATVNLTTTPVQIDDGTSYSVLVTNTDGSVVELSRGGRLQPNQSLTVYPEGAALTAATTSGTGTVTTSTTAAPLPNAADPTALAANAAFTGRYTQKANNLSDVAATSTARTNLGLGTAAVMSTAQIAADSALTGTYAALGIAGREAWKAQFFTALRPFHVSLGNIATAPVNVLFVGDSRPEGTGTTNVAYRLPQAFADLMRRRFQPSTIVGGFGYIPVRYAQTLTGAMVTDNIGGGIQTTYGLGRRNLNFTGAAQTITFTFTGTGFDLYYRTDPSLGVFSYAVDGGSATNITPTAANGTAKTSVTGLSVASHTVVLARVSGTTVVQGLVAFNGDEAAGLRVYEGGHSGYKVSDYTSGQWVDDVSLAQPSLVVISLLTNDFGGGAGSQPRTAAQAQADLGTLMTNIAAKCTISPTFVIEAPSYPDNALTGTYDAWTAYVAAAYAVAAARTDCIVLDTYKRWGSLSAGSTVGGLNAADKIHQTNAGYRTIASALADLVSPV